MHRKLIIMAIGGVYYTVAWYGLFLFGAEILLTSIVLFGIPAYALARFSVAPTPVLVSVTMVGVGLSFLLESIAHIYGLWYTLGVESLKIFSVIPVEAVAAMVLQVLFLALLYESLFDDGMYTTQSAQKRLVVFSAFLLGILVLILVHSFIGERILKSASYIWINISLLGVCFASLALYRAFTIQFLDRLVYFVGVAMVPLVINLAVSVTNVHKIFANFNEYTYTFMIFNEYIPLEEVVLVMTIPFFVAIVYEVYLDNQA